MLGDNDGPNKDRRPALVDHVLVNLDAEIPLDKLGDRRVHVGWIGEHNFSVHFIQHWFDSFSLRYASIRSACVSKVRIAAGGRGFIEGKRALPSSSSATTTPERPRSSRTDSAKRLAATVSPR